MEDAQIESQMVVLNDDFRRRNANRVRVPEPFKPVVADARIEFVLAVHDLNGAATNGITRIRTHITGFTSDTVYHVKARATGGADPWPSERYLHVWVCQLDNDLRGRSTPFQWRCPSARVTAAAFLLACAVASRGSHDHR